MPFPSAIRVRRGVLQRAGLLLMMALVASGSVPAWADPSPSGAAAATPSPAAGGAAVADVAAGIDTPALRALREQAAVVRQQLTDATAAYQASKERLDAARADAARTRAAADAARQEVEIARRRIAAYARAAYQGAAYSDLEALVRVATDPDPTQSLDGLALLNQVRESQNTDLDNTTALRRRADELARQASAQEAAAAAMEAGLADQLQKVQQLAADSAAALAKAAQVAHDALVAAQAQDAARAAGADQQWQAYLSRLTLAGVAPPPAAALRDPAQLPAGLSPVVSAAGVPTPGVAQVLDAAGRPLLILPAETVQAVSAAVGALGKPYADTTRGPDRYDCGGLVAAAYPWLPDYPSALAAVTTRVDAATVQPGDLVFLAGAPEAPTHVGIALGDGQLLDASRATGTVRVEPVPAGSALVTRPTLGRPAGSTLPARGALSPTRCGRTDAPVGGISGGSGAWGGWTNGMIPPEALCPLPGTAGHRLRCDAAAAYAQLAAAYQTAFNTPLCITDSYRSYASQVDLFARKPSLAAIPGTSNHGWGLAVDLCGGLETAGTPQDSWLKANAGAYGWYHPTWAEPNGSRPEPWHWEYGG